MQMNSSTAIKIAEALWKEQEQRNGAVEFDVTKIVENSDLTLEAVTHVLENCKGCRVTSNGVYVLERPRDFADQCFDWFNNPVDDIRSEK